MRITILSSSSRTAKVTSILTISLVVATFIPIIIQVLFLYLGSLPGIPMGSEVLNLFYINGWIILVVGIITSISNIVFSIASRGKLSGIIESHWDTLGPLIGFFLFGIIGGCVVINLFTFNPNYWILYVGNFITSIPTMIAAFVLSAFIGDAYNF